MSSAHRPTWLVVLVLSLAGLVVSVMQTLLVPLIPELPSLLGVSPEDASWLITVTLLASAVATPSMSRLADMLGKRRLILAALAAMAAGSVIGALSTSLGVLIVARALQGCGIALIPIAISAMRDELPRERLGAAVALMSATLGIGGAIGLPISGLIYTHLGWHALFWLSGALALILLVAIAVIIPESPVRTGGTFDALGAVLLSGVLIAILLGITKGGHWGWLSSSTIGCFGSAIVLLAVWVPWEFRSGQPLVDLRVSLRRPVLLTNIASFLIGFAMYCNMILTTEFLQMPTSTGYGLALNTVQAGMCMLPAALMMVFMAPVSARITHMFGAKTTLIVGASTLVVGYLLRVILTESAWQVVLGATIVSTGTAIAYASMPILIMRAVPVTETAAANGLNTVLRSIGTSTASAAVAAILTSVVMEIGGVTLPTLAAFQVVFVFAAGAAALGGIVALWLPRRAHGVSPDEVRLPIQDSETVIRGTALLPNGEPAAHARVLVSQQGGATLDWALTDDLGEFAITMPSLGHFTLEAVSAERRDVGIVELDAAGPHGPVIVELRSRITA